MDGALTVDLNRNCVEAAPRRWGHHICVKCRIRKPRSAFSLTPTTHAHMCCDGCRCLFRKPGVRRCAKCLERKPRSAFSQTGQLHSKARCDDCLQRYREWRLARAAAKQAAQEAWEAQRQLRAKRRVERECGQRLTPDDTARAWPPKRVADLEHALAIEGLSYREAAKRFGTTRNAIAGAISNHLPHLRKSPSSPHAPALRRGDDCVRKVGG